MTYKAEPYRWVALFCVVPILAVTQLFWLTFSAISDTAAQFYNVTPFSIAFLSMSYMIIYIIMTIPASMLADKKGLRAAFITGAVITAVFGLMRGLCAGSFTLVVIAQIGMAVAQPFLMNPITKLAAAWFPVNERATATGHRLHCGLSWYCDRHGCYARFGFRFFHERNADGLCLHFHRSGGSCHCAAEGKA